MRVWVATAVIVGAAATYPGNGWCANGKWGSRPAGIPSAGCRCGSFPGYGTSSITRRRSGLTQFGDRRPGHRARNRKAVGWIEAQLRSYGCPTERVLHPRRRHRRAAMARGRPLPAIPRAVVAADPRHADATGVNTDARNSPMRLRALNARPTDGPARGGLLHEGRLRHPERCIVKHAWTGTAGAKPPMMMDRARRW